MNEQKKKMPQILYLTIFLCVLGIICAGILAGINAITSPVIKENTKKELEKQLAAVNVTDPTDISSNNELLDGVDAIYSGVINGNTSCYVFQVTIKNSYTTITSLIVIGKEDGKIKAFTPLSGKPSFTTHGKDSSFVGNDFNLVDSNSSDYEVNFESVAGATVSSGSISNAVKTAYQQYEKGLKA